MSEPNLAATMSTLRSEIGRRIGTTRTYSSMTTDSKDDVDGILVRGLRAFYWPMVLDGDAAMHAWSFLKPSHAMNISANIAEYDLPDDFGGMEDEIIFDTGRGYRPLELRNENQIRQLNEDSSSSTGIPMWAAILPKRTDGIIGQRFKLLIGPTPDGSYTVRVRYSILPDKLVATTNEYPYGGSAHSNTILMACLAQADMLLNTETTRQALVHWQAFVECLRSSIEYDRRFFSPQKLGVNTIGRIRQRLGANRDVTYKNVLYTS